MSKGLEALESIKDSFKFNVHKLVYNANKNDFKIIEKELIDGEKNKKALEIIRNKPQHELAQIQWKKVNTYEEYKKLVYRWDSDYWDMIYTKEEFDLLKEVLL